MSINIASIVTLITAGPILSDIQEVEKVVTELGSKDTFEEKETVVMTAIENLFPEFNVEEQAAQEVITFLVALLHLGGSSNSSTTANAALKAVATPTISNSVPASTVTEPVVAPYGG